MEKKSEKADDAKTVVGRVFDVIRWALPFIQGLIERIFSQVNKR